MTRWSGGSGQTLAFLSMPSAFALRRAWFRFGPGLYIPLHHTPFNRVLHGTIVKSHWYPC